MLPQVTFRGLPPSSEIVETVCKKAKRLSDVAPLLSGCHVVIEASRRGNHGPISYYVLVQLSGGTGAVRRSPRHATHANLQAALSEAFRATRRQLEPRGNRFPDNAFPLRSVSRI
jgi:hypothetical protein